MVEMRRITRLAGWASVLAVLLTGVGAGAAASGAATPGQQVQSGLEASGPGLPDGGPAILHQPLATSPQLESVGVWKADPILISGASAYRDGEFVYQDFLYDDRGDGSSPYPAGATYAGNAADFVELRLKPVAGGTAFRITYNTLLDPAVVGTTLALGTSSTTRAWPHGARVSSPAQVFVTVHGDRAEVVDAATGAPLPGHRLPVTVDLLRRQVEVVVPHGVFEPGKRADVRVAAGTGVWNPATGQYLAPDTGAALYNVAFRFNETTHPRGLPGVATWWRDSNQTAALTARDVSQFHALVDFGKLDRRVDDDMPGQPTGVPVSGSMTRIYVTHFPDGQGRGTTTTSTGPCEPPACSVQFRGALQPYFVHVPTAQPATGGYGLTAWLHGCGNNHHMLFGSQFARDLSERGPSLVIAGGGRGDCLWWEGVAATDLFEIWADVATRYPLDPNVTALAGTSMGGYGTFRTATLYPELFARIWPLHACTQKNVTPDGPDPIRPSLPSLRHVPVALWNSVNDPLCNYAMTRVVRQELSDLGYASSLFTLANDHWSDITNDVMTPGVEWVAGHHVVRNPARVTYVVNPQHSYPQYGLNPDRAYWVSRLVTRSAGTGTVDARSHGLGRTDRSTLPLQAGSGVLTGGTVFPAVPYTFEANNPGSASPSAAADRVDITVTNVRSLTIDRDRADVTCGADLRVTTDGPVTVTLAGCPGSPRTFGA